MDKNRWIKRFLLVVIFGFVIGLQFGCIKEEFDEYGYYKEVNLDYVSNQNEGANVKNIILIIGDGMGENQVKLTEKYGLRGSQALDILKAEYKGLIDTNCLNNYVTDSAAAATAMATGVRTLYERVGMDEEGNELKTILDYAYENNMGTGLLTTDNLDGATPLAFSSHGTNRYLNKEDMKDIGKGFVIRKDQTDANGREFIRLCEDESLPIVAVLCGHIHGYQKSQLIPGRSQICCSSGMVGFVHRIVVRGEMI